MKYVNEEISRARILERGASYQFSFGPPSSGVVEVDVRGIKDLLVEFPDPFFLPQWVLIELLDGDKRVVAHGEGKLSYTVPASASPGTDWTVRLTNKSHRQGKVRVDVAFIGYRPLRSKEVPFRLLNEKLELIFTDPPPVKVVVENKTVTGIDLGPVTIPAVVHTIVRFEAKRDVQLVYGDELADIDLGTKVLSEGSIETQDISVRATIHDGKFALKARVRYKSNGACLAIDWFPDLRIGSGFVELYLVLEQNEQGQPWFRPMVNAQVAGSVLGRDVDFAMRGGIESAIESKLPRKMLERLAQICMTWILGDRNRRLINRRYEMQIRYAGDEVGPIVEPDEQPLPPIAQGKLSAIKNIVVLMMENRSFDHMLGHLTLEGRRDVDGLRLDMSNKSGLKRRNVFRLGTTVGIHDPGHDFEATKRQRGAMKIKVPLLPDIAIPPNGGFLMDYELRLIRAKLSPDEVARRKGDVMGYYASSDLPVYAHLAEEFTICERWFASHPGHTWPNRFIAVTGRLAPGPDGKPQINNPDIATFDPLDAKSIFDHLDAASPKVDWRYYEHDVCFLRLFERYTEDRRIVNIDDPERGFWLAARTGTLPPVTFIEPSLTDLPPGNDDHPPSDIRAGQGLVGRIYNALRNSPQWQDTLFIITYDEHGGFFDHVHPEAGQAVALCHDPETGEPVTHYGFRVPALVVSPHVRKRFSSKEVFDHTTILKTIIQTFLHARPPDMGPRVAAAKSLESLIHTPILDRRLIALDQLPRAELQPAARLAQATNDFHALMTRGAARRKAGRPTRVVRDHR